MGKVFKTWAALISSPPIEFAMYIIQKPHVISHRHLTDGTGASEAGLSSEFYSAQWSSSKSWEMSNFSGSTGSVGQSDCVLQIISTRLLDPFCNNKQEEAGKYPDVIFFSPVVCVIFHWLTCALLSTSKPDRAPQQLEPDFREVSVH
jgi:hypothetical protein